MNRHTGSIVFLGVIGLLCGITLCLPGTRVAAGNRPPVATASGDVTCAGCHQAIYDRYRQTPMAHASGAAMQGLQTGGFHHEASGVDYRVFVDQGEAVMSYERAGSHKVEALSGRRDLLYTIGSGHRGRTYLYEEGGLWFEAPINYYSKKALWDMAPNYGSARAMPDGLPVDPNCLHCHATVVQPSLASVRNRYSGAPIGLGGIGCASCHGDASAHLAHPVDGNIANPAKLTVSRRDSVCLQCHLEGDAAIYRAGKSLADFKAGDDLPEYVDYFVKASAEDGGGRAASQWEALLRSACKRASGDKLTCTTCHDPHESPPEAERVSFFRNKCLACHTGERMATQHHPEQPDCATCHMPTRATADISHEQTTDHNIQARPQSARPGLTTLSLATLGEPSYRLVPIGNIHPGDRETGLAYAQAAQGGNREALAQGLLYLRRAEAAGADDAELHTQLGLLDQLAGQSVKALNEYDRAIALNPNEGTALGNKAILSAASGHAAEAVHLLQRVLQNDPSQVAAGLNLAYIECVVGNKESARGVLTNLQRYSPDDPAVRSFLQNNTYAGRRCDLQLGTDTVH
jgi:tetratricopeptide (TPR) repeat protein